jgi:hypothetical protein
MKTPFERGRIQMGFFPAMISRIVRCLESVASSLIPNADTQLPTNITSTFDTTM